MKIFYLIMNQLPSDDRERVDKGTRAQTQPPRSVVKISRSELQLTDFDILKLEIRMQISMQTRTVAHKQAREARDSHHLFAIN